EQLRDQIAVRPLEAPRHVVRIGGRVDAARGRVDQRQVGERDLLRTADEYAARRAVLAYPRAAPRPDAVRGRDEDRVLGRVEVVDQRLGYGAARGGAAA